MHPDGVTDRLSFVVSRDWVADAWRVSWFLWSGTEVLVRSGELTYDARLYDAGDLERLLHAAMVPLVARLGAEDALRSS